MLKWPSIESRKSDDVAPIHVIEHRNIHIPLMTKLRISAAMISSAFPCRIPGGLIRASVNQRDSAILGA
jgi:hypothetical protein